MRMFLFKKLEVIFLIGILLFTSLSQTLSGFGDEKNKNGTPGITEVDESPNFITLDETEWSAPRKLPIYLNTAEFVTHESQPEIPRQFRSPNFVASDERSKNGLFEFNLEAEDYFIIQFIGPIETEWKEQINEMGIELFYYIPDYAFYAYGELSVLPKLQNLNFVNWFGPLHPFYRVQPELLEMIQAMMIEPDSRQESIMISLRPINDLDSLIDAVNYIGADIMAVDPGNYVVCTLTIEMAYQLIFTKNLIWMEFHSFPELINNQCSKTLKIRQTANGSFSNNGQSLWSYNHNTDKFEGYPGNDVIIAMADSGVDGTHPAFDNKKIWFYNYGTNQENTWTDGGSASGHGTHTSGTALGTGAWRTGDSGEAGKYAGMAPAAGLIGQAIFQGGTIPQPATICNDAVKHGANISSNSWGWPGTAGNYDNTAVSYDGLVRDSNGKEFTIVFGTGNEGPGTIRSPSTAKNVISVGATDNNNGDSVTGFSSGGPTDDDRTKPDVVAPGQLLASCGWRDLGYGKPSDGQNSYFYATGTSMATPAASGACAVIIDYFNHTYGYPPSPALVKALLINGAVPIDGYTYPGNRQGWGRINLANSLLEKADKRFFIVNQNISLTTNDDQLYYFSTKGSSTNLRITLTWTDVPGSPGSGKNLVNDLDLILESPDGKIYYGNYFRNGMSADKGEADDKNNVEGLSIPKAPAGGWILTIVARNIPDGPQDFALVIAGDIKDISKGYRDIEVKPSLNFPTKVHLEGDSIVLNGSFINNGSIPSINIRYKIIHIMPDLVEETLVDNTLPQMNVLERHYVEYKWTAIRGSHAFKFIIDPYNTIREEREDNNLAENSIWIDNYGIELSILEDTKLALPGDVTKYTLKILNTGTLLDTYDLTASTPPTDWLIDLSDDAVVVSSNTTQNILFSVTPPIYAQANKTVEFKVKIVSRGNSTYSGVLKMKTIVEQYYEFHLEYPTLSQSILPGVEGKYQITINNTGNGPDEFVIGSTGGKYGWDWKLSDQFVKISARGIYNLTLSVTPPKDGLADEDCKIQIYVVDTLKIIKEVEITSYIERVFESRLDIVIPALIADTGSRLRYPLTAHNLGNIDDSYRFSSVIPSGWSANFSRSTIDISSREFNRFYFEIRIPNGELPDEYELKIFMESLETGLIQEYIIVLEVNQFFSLQAEVEPVRDRVYQGQDAIYELTVINYGTGRDSAQLDYSSLPRDWRLVYDNNVLGIGFEGTNKTRVYITTDILAEDGSYDTLLKVTSAGNNSVYAPVTITTVVDHSLMEPKVNDSDNDQSEDGFNLFGKMDLFSLLILLFVPIIIFIIAVFIIIRIRKNKKAVMEEEEARNRIIQEEQAKEHEFKSLYSEDLTMTPRATRPSISSGTRVDYLEPPRQTAPPWFSSDQQLPMGPLPERTEQKEYSGPGKDSGRSGKDYFGTPLLPPKNDFEEPATKKFDIFLPDAGPDLESQSFKSITPEKTKDFEFEKKGPVFADSTPLEWKSVKTDDYEKTFELGSSPELVDGKRKKKKNDRQQ